MKKKAPLKTGQPLTTAERLGHVWAGIFGFIVLTLLVVLVGKACFFAPQ